MKLNWKFQEDGGFKPKNLPCGVWIFSGTTQYNKMVVTVTCCTDLSVFFRSILSYIIGIIWLCALSDRAFNGRVYFSENALLPGLVEAEYKNHRLASELFGKLSTVPEGDMRYFLSCINEINTCPIINNTCIVIYFSLF